MKESKKALNDPIMRYLHMKATRRQALLGMTAFSASVMNPFSRGIALADEAGKQSGPGGIELARPNHPVQLPLHEDPIESGLPHEKGGTLRIFMAVDYIDKNLLVEFGKKYDVAVEVTPFDSTDQIVPKLAANVAEFDIVQIPPNLLGLSVAGKLLKPINKDYVPNLSANVWPTLHSPFYDVGARYTVPYVVYTTGIGWRSDRIKEDIANLANPWSIFWEAEAYEGYVGVVEDVRETLAMAMLYRGYSDINTEDAGIINRASDDLRAMTAICNPKIDISQYQTLATGDSWLHQSWSGDLLQAYIAFRPEGDDGSALRYWSAPPGKGPIQNDCWAICASSTQPVLAHLFMNFILDEDVAYRNFVDFTGYQPPQVSITPDRMITEGIIPENLKSTIIASDDAGPNSLRLMNLTIDGAKLWQDAYARFAGG